MNATSDFDFFMGSWTVRNRYLRGRLQGSTDWIEFDAASDAWPLLGGLANVDSYRATRDGREIEGMTFRLFNPATGEWTIHWADTIRPGTLCPPMTGRFTDGVGEFYGDEEVNGRTVLCRFLWTAGEQPRWEQAFSGDEGKTWETNWIMDFTRRQA
jgi:hypothetical protein